MDHEARNLGHDQARSVELRGFDDREDNLTFEIFDEYGDYLGYAHLVVDPQDSNQILVNNIDIEFISNFRNKNKGFGNLIYEKLVDIVKAKRKKFVSSPLANDFALNNWRHLVSKGIAKQDPNKRKFDTDWYYVDPPNPRESLPD